MIAVRAWLVLCLLLFACAAPAHAKPPNILVIVADQWRAQATGYAGDPNVKTPNLDRLAAESANFTNAVSGCPVCTPFRGSLITGQRPLTHGLFLNDVPLRDGVPSLAKSLAAAGYDTGFIGKWHIAGGNRSAFIPREKRQSFDYWKVLECTHDYNKSAYYGDTNEKLQWKGYDAIAQTADAQQYIRDHAAGKPFALILAWGPPHNPYGTAPEQFKKLYDPATLKLRDNVPASAAKSARVDLAGYYAHCSALDTCIGNLWQTLKDVGVEENTVIVFTSDHGDMLGSHSQVRKQRPYDESVRVPMLWHYPAALGRMKKELEAPMNSEDIMPTLLGFAGVATPDGVEGLNYSPYMTGGKNPNEGNAAVITCVTTFGEWTHGMGGREYRGVRTPRHTYVRDLKGPWLLFDNQADPYQEHNLVGEESAAKVQADLDALLKSRLAAAKDEFHPGMEYIRKWGYKVDSTGTAPY